MRMNELKMRYLLKGGIKTRELVLEANRVRIVVVNIAEQTHHFHGFMAQKNLQSSNNFINFNFNPNDKYSQPIL